jgi:TonB family protein
VLKALVLTFALLGSSVAQVEKRTCDHPAPPEGMHYVCSPKDSCDCWLERNSSEGSSGDGVQATTRDDNANCASATLKYFVAPAYPPAARAAKKQGTVAARLTVDASGTAQIKIESGDPQLAESVVSALSKWRFAPAEQPRTIAATFTFAIAGDATDSMRTTVAGSSPLNLVISASPPLR